MNIWMKPPGFWLMFSVKDLHGEGYQKVRMDQT